MTDFAAPAFRQVLGRDRSAAARTVATVAGSARDNWRLMMVVVALALAYGSVALRMGLAALEEPREPRLAATSPASVPGRGEILDRNGNLLAGNLPAYSLYANPREIKDPARVAPDLARTLPDLSEDTIRRRLSREARFVWIRRPVTPRERRKVLDLGYPGLKFGTRAMRVYPPGRTVAHLMGRVKPGAEYVSYAEFVGTGGVEGFFDERLREAARFGEPVTLSIDLPVQAALREVLARGVDRYAARGGAAVLLEVATGEILAMVSLPDFDPNRRPEPFSGPAELSPYFNRAVLGRYELGSVFKPLTAVFALDAGLVSPDTLIETGASLRYGRYRIRDIHRMDPQMTVTDIIVRSSNVGAARLGLTLGSARLRGYLARMGLTEPLAVELAEARRSAPLVPARWTDLSTMTISYGHGIAVSPLHLAAAYATIANGGRRVLPTLVKGGGEPGPQVISPEAARAMVGILSEVVRRGTGRRADIPGYEIGGKTGTADKPRPGGGYWNDRTITTFASVFPTSAPKYALVITLDEPVDREAPRSSRRQASRTAVPLTRVAITRLAPLLGLRPLPVATKRAAEPSVIRTEVRP